MILFFFHVLNFLYINKVPKNSINPVNFKWSIAKQSCLELILAFETGMVMDQLKSKDTLRMVLLAEDLSNEPWQWLF